MMAIAYAEPRLFAVICPRCGAEIGSPEGPGLWTTEQVERLAGQNLPPATAPMCAGCGEFVTVVNEEQAATLAALRARLVALLSAGHEWAMWYRIYQQQGMAYPARKAASEGLEKATAALRAALAA